MTIVTIDPKTKYKGTPQQAAQLTKALQDVPGSKRVSAAFQFAKKFGLKRVHAAEPDK